MLGVVLRRKWISFVAGDFFVASSAEIYSRMRNLFAGTMYVIPMLELRFSGLLNALCIYEPSHVLSSNFLTFEFTGLRGFSRRSGGMNG